MQPFSTKTKIIVVLFLVLFANLAASKNVYAQGIQGDLDADGDVDIFDYNILVENFGKTSTPTNTPTPPPPDNDPRITCEGYPEKRVFLESQSWWSDAR